MTAAAAGSTRVHPAAGDGQRLVLPPALLRAAVPLGLAGAVLLAVGCLLAWSTYSGFPGKMTLSGFAGGARLYPLLLAGGAGVLLVLAARRPVHGQAGALRAMSRTALAVVLLTLLLIGYAGGGLVNVAPGAWVALVGAVLLVLSAQGLPPGPARPGTGRLSGGLEQVAVVASIGVLLLVIVEGLRIPTSDVANGPDFLLGGALSLNQLTNEGQFLAFLVLLVGAGLALSRLKVLERLGEMSRRHRPALIVAAGAAAIAFPFTQGGNSYFLRVAASIGVFAAAALGLNIVVGLAGLLDLGYIAFFGVGAYVAALFSGAASSTIDLDLPFGVVLVLGAVIAGIFGVLLGAPTLRLRGDYLAIVTLGFGEIFRIAAFNLDGSAGPDVTNGPNGIGGIPNLQFAGFDFGAAHEVFGITLPYFANYYFLEIVLVAVVMTAFLRMSESRVGRAWVAIREDELAASAMGINTTRLKLLAFAMGAVLAGAAGTVNAHVASAVTPDSFTFFESALLLAAVILGGMGTVPGALLGATVLLLLPEKLRFLQDLRLLFFGAALILLMRFRPEGLVPSRRRAREFHDDESGGDALSAAPDSPSTPVGDGAEGVRA
ncbi:MAG: branched-chain amino acid ABC transporter permease [Actinomycetota bacterium]|nr:branched-chain amino acid ABC transporter permease [Actinomycetota bacterium]